MKKCKYEIKDDNGNLIYKCDRVPWKDETCYLHDPYVPTTVKIRRAYIENGETFKQADLTGAIIPFAKLNNADLSGANLTKANLQQAKLKRANLTDANLTDANLTDANLSGANLTKANLQQAKLKRANLTDADLSGANLHLVKFGKTSLYHVYWEDKQKEIYPKSLKIDTSSASYLKKFYEDKSLFKRSDHFYVKQMFAVHGEPEYKKNCKSLFKWSFWKSWLTYAFKHPLYFLWWSTARFGVGIRRWVATSVFIAVFFGAVFRCCPTMFVKTSYWIDGCWQWENWFAPYYFSIVTFTTLGFGDITPATFCGMIWVTLEVILGYIMLGGLIAIFAKKFIRN